MFPCSLMHVPKKCCDQPGYEPPSEERAKPSNSLRNSFARNSDISKHQFWRERRAVK